jgi:hypothetical protein
MSHSLLRSLRTVALVLAAMAAMATPLRAQNIVINEIMYHPLSQNPRDEFIELYNRETTNVNLTGWLLSRGVDFAFPSNTIIRATNYLVIAAHRQTFTNKFPAVTNVVGDFLIVRTTNYYTSVLTNYENTLSNTRNEVRLENAAGTTIDSVTYADEGDWAQRQRSLDDGGFRGWIWLAEHDGLGKSLELRNSALPNEYGQNWAASTITDGTPGRSNSVASANIPPMILDVSHFPIVPRSSNSVSVTARIINETAANVTVRLAWRVDGVPSFTTNVMFDDGAHQDGLPNDGVYAGSIVPQANNTVVEYYVVATDGQGNTRTWPAATLAAEDIGGPATQSANALYQVDDATLNDFGGTASLQPVYKLIMTAAEANQLQTMPCNIPSGDAPRTADVQMNATFINLDGSGADVRYLIGIKRRGHGSRCANPRNYRIHFVSAEPFKDALGLNLNTRQVHMQHLGATLALKAGAVGPYTRAVQVRVNNVNSAESAGQMFGSYAANEIYDSTWAEHHFPLNDGGNIYKVIRDVNPPNFDYRGSSILSYTNTYFKESNTSEDDWLDLMTMLSVMGENTGATFTNVNIRRVIDPEQWLLHLATMNMMGNGESGLNTGNNDDYFLYRGGTDPRFVLSFHDLDQILGQGGSMGTGSDIFRATGTPVSGDTEGTWRAMTRFLHSPDFEPSYYATLQRLLDTTFSKPQFDSVVDSTLGSYVTPGMINNIKSWMDARRTFVQNTINGFVPPVTNNPVATISNEPRSPTPFRNASLVVGGEAITHYRFKLNNGTYGAETPVSTLITLPLLPQGSTNTVYVIGKNTNNVWQSTNAPTVSSTWVVNTNTPTVRLNELLASNVAGAPHNGMFPDTLELFNDGTAPVALDGLRLTDDKDTPGKFTFPPGTTLGIGTYLVVYLNNADGTPGLHTGFSVDADGDQVYLFDRVTNGPAILDSVSFGPQITDLSIGRISASEWALTQPTFGSANVTQSLGSLSNLRLNEWLAASGAGNDFVELYNRNGLPIALGGSYLSDTPIGYPTRHRFHDLTFIAANSFLAFTADGDNGNPMHINFQLAAELGEIALFSPSLSLVDCVSYGPQIAGVSIGRCPDGTLTNRSLAIPTPGSMNACPAILPPPPTSPLVLISNVWRYDETFTDLGTTWKDTNFPDNTWLQGPGLLGTPTQNGTGTVPEPIRTFLSVANNKNTFYFRTRFTNNVAGQISALEVNHVIDDGAVFYLNGQEFYRYNMNPGTPVFLTLSASSIGNVAQYSGSITAPATNLFPGVNVLAVEVHQSSATSPDILFGTILNAVLATNSPIAANVVINEVLADNAGLEDADGSTPDWVEFYNPSTNAVDMADMSLTDDTAIPRRWVFPPGSILTGQGYLRVRFDGDRPASATNTGWGLSASGDAIYLYNSPAIGGSLRDAITFGLQITDFSIARLPSGSTNWNLALPTIGSANFAATLGNPTVLKVNEWMANPAPGDDDYFEIFNPGAQPVALGGLWLTDDLSTRNKHPIAPLSFIGVATNAWTEFKADGNTASGADHVSFSLRAAGEGVGISLPNLTLIDGITFTNQPENISQGRLPDGNSNTVYFPGTASPGNANYLLMTNIVINEALTHTDLPLEDAIELRNIAGGSSANISGWWLSDSRGQPQKYQIPAGTNMPGNSFRVFYENQFNSTDFAAIPFSLSSAKGDQIYLSAADTNGVLTGYRAIVEFGAAENGVSFGRYVNSVGQADFTAMAQRTFGVDTPATVEQFRTGTGRTNTYPRVGPIVFSEIMYNPPLIGTNDNTRDEFLELRNITAAAVSLYDTNFPTNRWRLRGGVDFDFPGSVTIPASGTIVVVSFSPTNTTDATAFRAAYGLSNNVILYGPWSGKLDNGGERIELQKPDAPQTTPGPDFGFVPFIAVETIRYSDTLPWATNADGGGRSLQRVSNTGYGNDPTNWLGALPNPMPSVGGAGDTDGDGMPDTWEQLYSFNILDPSDANGDEDMDGMTNLQEYLTGTHPRDNQSVLRLKVSLTPANAARVQFDAMSNLSYTMQFRNSAATGTWINLSNVPAVPTNRTVIVTNTVVPSSTRFYRVSRP